MPFTAAQIANAGRSSLDYYANNTPIDQIAQERPFLKTLVAKKKTFPGGKQFVIEPLRTNYGSNFQWYRGNQTVTYNQRQTLSQASFPWGGFHDGFEIDEDTLFQNGIEVVDDGKPTQATDNEKLQLVDLFKEQTESLSAGLEQSLDLDLHRAGVHATEAVTGLDALVSLTPNVGVVGGIDRAASPWWRNHVATGVNAGNIIDRMEKAWRACTRNGGQPDFIMMGSDMIDLYAAAVGEKLQINVNAGESYSVEGGNTGHTFKRVPIIWNPSFEDLDTLDAPATKWTKRCYFINSKFLKLRTGGKHWMQPRQPKRGDSQYVHKFAITGKLALTINRANAHAVLAAA